MGRKKKSETAEAAASPPVAQESNASLDAEDAESQMKYFAVFYSKDGTIHLWPANTKEECSEKLTKMLKDVRIKERYLESAIIKRDLSNYPDGYIFGTRGSVSIDPTED